MKPLQPIGLGLVLIALEARLGGYDLYADPLGWLLVLFGVARLDGVAALASYRPALRGLALLALLVAVAVWLPAGDRWLADSEPALAWAANLPRFGFLALLCHALVAAARVSDDPRRTSAIAWLRTCELLLVLVMLAPVLVFGAGWTGLGGIAALAAQLLVLVLLVLCFVYAGRRWAGAREDPGPAVGSSRDAAE